MKTPETPFEVPSAGQHSFYYPSEHSVRGRICGALLRGEKLTQQDSLRRFSDFRLSAHIEVLRKRGWPIETELVEVGTLDAGRRAEVAEYSMPANTITAAGERGQLFAEAARLVEIERRAA